MSEPVEDAERRVIEAAVLWSEESECPTYYEKDLRDAVDQLLKARAVAWEKAMRTARPVQDVPLSGGGA